jgi:hypothetical protein
MGNPMKEASYILSGFHNLLRQKPSSLFMLLGGGQISIVSLMKQSEYLDLV